MCGITGIYSFSKSGNHNLSRVESAIKTLNKRGPDFMGTFRDECVGLGHSRLSIIDTSNEANQPFKDPTGRYVIVYNGEIYNFKELKLGLIKKGYNFRSQSDTEVLLYSYMEYGSEFLSQLNGFFSFAIFDKVHKSLFVARDRIGIKPFYYYQDEDQFLFGSELKAIFQYNIPREINFNALSYYLQLTYVPAPYSILNNCFKLEPGYQMLITPNKVEKKCYFNISYGSNIYSGNYNSAKKELKSLIYESVEKRLVSDVPLGSFLSGGVDSSIIAGVANQLKPGIKTFSIGYSDHKHFDETSYANLAAKKFGTDHTVFELGNKDFEESIEDILDYIDEPFADSSSIAVFILSKKVRKEVKVALSGDGADELFAGYNKHRAEFKSRKKSLVNNLIARNGGMLAYFPQSRNGKLSNFVRQIVRYSEGLNLLPDQRYWRWASVMRVEESHEILKETERNFSENAAQIGFRNFLNKTGNFDDVLFFDTKVVLPDDMLTKVDRMSMANGLEVRTPFLDHKIVDFAFSLPTHFKINQSTGKKLLKDTFKYLLPEELIFRAKKGFEIPLNDWLKTSLANRIEALVFDKEFILDQGIFDFNFICGLKKRFYSKYPGDSPTMVWLLFIFQTCWIKHFFK